jgi:hypothetical protein
VIIVVRKIKQKKRRYLFAVQSIDEISGINIVLFIGRFQIQLMIREMKDSNDEFIYQYE